MSSRRTPQLGRDAPARWDVFLSHKGDDLEVVARIGERLRAAGVEPWLDAWHLTAGERWQERLNDGIRLSRAFCYFLGPSGVGDWAAEELDVARSRAAADSTFRLIPVLLPGVPDPFDRTTMPAFLGSRTWVDLRAGVGTRTIQALINAVKGVPSGAEQSLPAAAGVCPYRGLRAFEKEDAPFFFGREADVQRLVEMFKGSRFVAVMGASGSGKSSLVRAGLVPALEGGALSGSTEWPVVVVKPGGRPLEALAAKLEAMGEPKGMASTLDRLAGDERTLHLAATQTLGDDSRRRFVWVIDQAEEVFTLCHDEEERQRTIDGLLYAASVPNGRTIVVLAMRADFYPRCAAYPDFAAHIARSQYLVSPMTADGTRAAIEQPARAVGLEFEEGLVETITADIERQPGALPLLEHALLELWERRRGSMLTLEGYRESGGVQGAIAKRAESVYSRLDPEDQQIVHRALLRLTQPGEGTEDTRRRAAMSELITRPAEAARVEAVVNELTDARLLTASANEQTGDAWVDLSHEALIRGWPRVRQWLDDDRSSLLVHRRLIDAAQEWQRLGRAESELYRGARLAEAQEWRAAHEDELNELERGFVTASIELEGRERRLRLRRKRVTIASAILVPLLIVSLIGGFMVVRARDAEGQALAKAAAEAAAADRERALSAETDRQRRVALGGALGFQALENRDRPDLALLLEVEATRQSPVLQLERLLLEQLTLNPMLVRFASGGAQAVATSADGSTAAMVLDGQVRVSAAETIFDAGLVLTGAPTQVIDLAIDGTGSRVAALDPDGLTVWTLPGPSPTVHLPLTGPERAVFLADGGIAVADTFGGVDRYDADGTSRGTVLLPLTDRPPFAARPIFAPDGSLVARAEDDSPAVYTLPDGALVGGSSVVADPGSVVGPSRPIAIDPTDRLVAAQTLDGLTVYDIATRQAVGPSVNGPTDVGAAVFVGPGSLLVSSRSQGIGAIDVATGTLTWVASPPGSASVAPADVEGAGFSAHPGYGLARWDMTRATGLGLPDPVAAPSIRAGPFGVAVAATPGGLTRVSSAIADAASQAEPDPSSPAATPGSGDLPPTMDAPPAVGPPDVGQPPGNVHPSTGPPDDDGTPGEEVMPGRDTDAPGTLVEIVDVPTGARRSFSVDDLIDSIAITPDSLTVISTELVASGPATVDLVARSSATGEVLWRVSIDGIEPSLGTPIAISPDGTILATVEDARVTLRRTTDGRPIRSIGDVSAMVVSALAFSPDGTRLAAVGGVGAPAGPAMPAVPGTNTKNRAAFQLFSTEPASETGTPLRTIPGEAAVAVAFDAHQRLAIATTGAGTDDLSLFDAASGDRIGILGSGDTFALLDFSADGQEVISAAVATGWMRWPATIDAWQAAACSIASRDLTAQEWATFLPGEPYRATCGDG